MNYAKSFSLKQIQIILIIFKKKLIEIYLNSKKFNDLKMKEIL